MTPVQTSDIAGDRSAFEAAVHGACRVRRFAPDEVPREDVEQMVGLATCAASACDSQSWRFIAIQDPQVLKAMQEAVLARFEELATRPGLVLQEHKRLVARQQALLFAKAPLCVAVLALPVESPMEELLRQAGVTQEEHDRICARPDLQSAGAAVQLLTTSAHTLGYAACWMCAPIVAAERLEELLGVTPPARLVALVPIGRPASAPLARKRLPLDRVLSFR
jgi:nitroreductase